MRGVASPREAVSRSSLIRGASHVLLLPKIKLSAEAQEVLNTKSSTVTPWWWGFLMMLKVRPRHSAVSCASTGMQLSLTRLRAVPNDS